MEIQIVEGSLKLNKTLNDLDNFVIEFTSLLDGIGIAYVLVSGYVAILFGRNRSSEDIDIICEKCDFNKFKQLWDNLGKFECIITSNANDAYRDYLQSGSALRFARKNEFIPNMEIKFRKTELDEWTLQHRKIVFLNDKKLALSPFEIQIPFKLFLGSEKDIEDARYLYKILEKYVDKKQMQEFCRKLKIEQKCKRYLI